MTTEDPLYLIRETWMGLFIWATQISLRRKEQCLLSCPTLYSNNRFYHNSFTYKLSHLWN